MEDPVEEEGKRMISKYCPNPLEVTEAWLAEMKLLKEKKTQETLEKLADTIFAILLRPLLLDKEWIAKRDQVASTGEFMAAVHFAKEVYYDPRRVMGGPFKSAGKRVRVKDKVFSEALLTSMEKFAPSKLKKEILLFVRRHSALAMQPVLDVWAMVGPWTMYL
jgi:hypothetical protein